MKKLKKVLACMLAVLMICTAAPISALAAGESPNISFDVFDVLCYSRATKTGVVAYEDDSAADSDVSYNELKKAGSAELEVGDVIAINMMLTGFTTIKSFDLTANFDVNKLTAGSYTGWSSSGGAVFTEAESKADCVLDSITNHYENTTSSDFTVVTPSTGYYYVPILPTDGTFIPLTGQTTFPYAWNSADQDFTGITVDGDLICQTVFQVKQAMTVADLYDCFTIDTNHICTQISDKDELKYSMSGEDPALTWGDVGGGEDPTPTTTYTFNFKDGSNTTVEKAADEALVSGDMPANTATTCTANGDDANHTTTTYSWVVDEGDATVYNEVGTPVVAACSYEKTSTTLAPTCTAGGTDVYTCSVCGDTKNVATEAIAHNYQSVVTAPTCTEDGYTTYTCSVCGDSYTGNTTTKLGHDYQVTNTVGATCTVAGSVTYTCTRCNDTYTTTGALAPHTAVTDNAVAATCTASGLTEGSHCSVCGATIVAQEVVPAIGHTVVTDNAVAATCTETGLTEGSHCSVCGATIVAQEVVPAIGHTVVTDNAVAATCTESGLTEGSHCSVCNEVLVAQQTVDAIGHDYKVTDTKAATVKDAGYTEYTCNNCGDTYQDAIPALGVNITVASAALGSTNPTGTTNYAYGESFTMTATPNEGVDFIGWEVSGKIVSTDASYTTTAVADMTYTPVFDKAAAETITATFLDKYNNVVYTYSGTDFSGITMPTPPAVSGYTFAGWDMDESAIKSSTECVTVRATYTKDNTIGYTLTVSSDSVQITGTTISGLDTYAYDTRITLSLESATAWKLTGTSTIIGYGSTYSFYIGSNINVTPVTEPVATAVPSVAMVKATKFADSNKVAFLATRTVVSGYKLIDSGFVYGKNANADDLTLENVNGSTVKVAYMNDKAADGQFQLNYGCASNSDTPVVKAFLIYAKANGSDVTVIYSDALDFDYNA